MKLDKFYNVIYYKKRYSTVALFCSIVLITFWTFLSIHRDINSTVEEVFW